MGIKEVIAEYSTPMAGRNGNQSFNVNKSANTLSGVIVAPDETFSFNGRVGVTDAHMVTNLREYIHKVK